MCISDSCGYVGAHAFSGCDSLNVDGAIVIQDETKLGYSNSLVHQTAILDRVTAVLNGMFSLVETQTPIDQIFPEGWTSVKTGENNRTEQVGDTPVSYTHLSPSALKRRAVTIPICSPDVL